MIYVYLVVDVDESRVLYGAEERLSVIHTVKPVNPEISRATNIMLQIDYFLDFFFFKEKWVDTKFSLL